MYYNAASWALIAVRCFQYGTLISIKGDTIDFGQKYRNFFFEAILNSRVEHVFAKKNIYHQ